MSRYLQTSTENPYGHRPWATRLYTGFENYAFLKQPQNAIIREDVNMRPEIYRPPELKKSAGMGSVTLVGGSGRVLRRGRRGLGMINLGPMVNGGPVQIPRPLPPIIMLQPSSSGGSVGLAPTPMTQCPPLPPPAPGCSYNSAATGLNPCAVSRTCGPPPLTILPPSMVPPVPQPIYAGPGGIVYALPGDATTPGSPFSPSSLPAGSPSAAAAVAAASTGTLSTWFNAEDYIAGVPNGYIALGGALALYMFTKKKR